MKFSVLIVIGGLFLSPLTFCQSQINICSIGNNDSKHQDKSVDRVINIVVCGSPDEAALKKMLLQFSNKEDLRVLVKKLRKLTDEIEMISTDVDIISEQSEYQKRQIDEIKKRIENINTFRTQFFIELNNLQQNVKKNNLKIDTQFNELLESLAIRIEALKSEFNVQFAISIAELSQKLLAHELRISRVESDIGILMKEIRNGKIHRQVSFVGVSIGTSPSNKSLTKTAFEYEIFNFRPFNTTYFDSYHAEIGYLYWERDLLFETLPAQSSLTVVEDNSYGFLGLGVKKIIDRFSFSENYRSYWGTSIGAGVSGEKQLYLDLYAGYEFYRKRIKYDVELRVNFNSRITEKKIDFNPLGQSSVSLENGRKVNVLLLIKVYFG